MDSIAECDGAVTDLKVSYRWEIPNFCTTCPKTKRILKSPILEHHQSNSKFQLLVYPKGDKEETNKYVSAFLNLVGKATVELSCSISILNYENIEYYHVHFTKKYGPEYITSWGRSQFVKQNKIMNYRSEFLPDDKLTFLVEITVHKVFNDQDNSSHTSKRPRLDVSETLVNSYDFDKFFGNELLSDVTFVTIDDIQIHAHKCILAGKSDVFLDLFEKNIGKRIIKIKDIESKVLMEMLRFIYTNEVDDLTKIARDLLVSAGNYRLTELKQLCETNLCDNISTSTALDLVAYAESYKLVKLRKRAINYIVSNMKEVVKTPNFESMALKHPEICIEIIRRIAAQN